MGQRAANPTLCFFVLFAEKGISSLFSFWVWVSIAANDLRFVLAVHPLNSWFLLEFRQGEDCCEVSIISSLFCTKAVNKQIEAFCTVVTGVINFLNELHNQLQCLLLLQAKHYSFEELKQSFFVIPLMIMSCM